MKEVTSEQLDIIENAPAEEDSKAEKTSKAKSAKKAESKKKDAQNEMMDALEKVRQEERAKLEALQAREREKTRQMVEKERAKLEAELEKEIRALEAQLAKEMAKMDISQPVPSLSLTEEVPEAAPKQTARAKVASKPAVKKPKVRKVVQTAVGSIDLGTEPEQVPETPQPAEVPLESPEAPVAVPAQEAPQAVALSASEPAASASVEAPAEEVPVAADLSTEEAVPEVSETSVPDAVSLEAAPVAVKEIASAGTKKVVPEVSEAPVLDAVSLKAAPEVVKEAETPSMGGNVPETVSERETPTVLTSLEKLREKIFAQKRLERELLEKEAEKAQEKDRQLLDRMNQVLDELQLDDIQGAQAQVDALLEESERLRKRIDELEAIVNKVKALKIDNISVIDENTFEISNDFAVYAADAVSVNKLIKEIEAELESLTEEHDRTIAKLREAEAARDQFQIQILRLESENSASQQEIKRLRTELENKEKLFFSQINNLNNEIQKAEERLREERENNRGILTQIETLRFEKQKLINENSGLKAEIEMLKDKLDKRLESSINVAARIDLLEAEKSLLENKILQLNKQLIMKEKVKPEEKEEGPYADILSEIRRLKEDVEELKGRQTPSFLPDYAFAQGRENCPYVRFFNPTMIPNLSPQPQILNEELMREVKELKREFENFRNGSSGEEAPAEKPEPVVRPEEGDEGKRILEEYSQKLKEYQEELEKNKAELSLLAESKEKEIAKLTKDFEMKIEAMDKERDMIKAEKEKRIQELQQKVQEKEALLEKIKQEVQRLTEEDIFDPDFKRKIRVIRDKRRECEEKAAQEEEEYLKNLKAVKDKIDAKNLEIDVVNDKIFQLEMNFRQTGDFSNPAKEEYEKNKNKLTLERDLHEEKLRELEEDLSRLESKHQAFLKSNEEEIERLNAEEAETVDFYLNKLRRSRAKQMEIKSAESEKEEDDFEDEFASPKKEPVKEKQDEIEVDMPFAPQQDDGAMTALQSEIEEMTRQYSEYYRQITELKAEQDKRVAAEKRLRMSDKNVFDYCTSKINLDECLKAYQEKTVQMEEKEKELSGTTDRTAQLKLKAEIQDLEVHRNDLRAKIDFYRKQTQELERADIVQKYKILLSQIEKINGILKEKRDKAQEIKTLVQEKTKELEKLRG